MDFQPIGSRTGERVILETDFCTDVDDVAALSLLCGEAKRRPGAFTLAGISMNVATPFGAPAIKTVLSAFGMEDVPVAVTDDPNPPSGNRSSYLAGLAARWRGPSPASAGLPPELYRKVFEEAPDGSVSVISIGFFNVLADVLEADPELFRRKVRIVYAMAGGFGSKAGYVEFNVKEHAGATRRFLSAWDGPVVFVGSECGETVMTDLSGLPAECDFHPLVEAFRHHRGPEMKRSSWDPITVDLALNGEGDCYLLSSRGKVSMNLDRSLAFVPDSSGNARVARFCAPDETVSARITSLVREAAGLPPRAAGAASAK